jgi:serine/threonine protein kinase
LADETYTCPRCFHVRALEDDARFCAHCGLPMEADAAAEEVHPVDLAGRSTTYRVLDRIAVGSIANVYRCKFAGKSGEVEGCLKIARDARTNSLIKNEATILRRLHDRDDDHKFGAFMPSIVESLAYVDEPGSPAREANVLRLHPAIRVIDEVYTLEEVPASRKTPVTDQDMAWIWRRLLNILGYIHTQGFVHGAVVPAHVLIEPRDHKLCLIDYCAASAISNAAPLALMAGVYRNWYRRQDAIHQPPWRGLDIAFGARCMILLLGGDPLGGKCPATTEPAIERHLQRCLAAGESADAWRLLDDFDSLIGRLWGPREFRPFELPPKSRR